MVYSQKEIYEYLVNNPLNATVAIGDLESLNDKDYIFFDYTNDELIPYDNKGCYQSFVQITVATKDFEKRKTLVKYIKDKFNVRVSYEKSNEFQYYLARFEFGLFIVSDETNIDNSQNNNS